VDLRPVLRDGSGDDRVRDTIQRAWHARDDRYSEVRHEAPEKHKIEMSYIGG